MSNATAALSTGGGARRAASAILSESRFHQPRFPRPLHGLLNAFGRALDAPLRGLDSLVNWAGKAVPGGVAVVWAIFAAALLLTVALVAGHVASRRVVVAVSAPVDGEPSASELERLAAAAQAAGRLEEAVRLRFRAGLARLAERRVIAGAVTRPTADLSRMLGSARFDSLAGRFDEIVYGASPATTDDVDRQGREWPQILRASAARPPAESAP